MADFLPVLPVDRLPAQGLIPVEIHGRSVLVGRVQGHLVACLDRCPHAAASLRTGKLRGEELQCARHGWIFNVVTGEAVPDNPAFRLPTFPIKIEGSQVLIAVP